MNQQKNENTNNPGNNSVNNTEKQSDNSQASKHDIKGMFDGPILPLLIRLALPVFAGMFFHLFYHITDTICISWIDLDDPSFVGGTGLIYPVLVLITALSNGLIVGISSLVSRSIGKKDNESLNKTVESGLFIGIVLSLFFLIPGYIFSKDIVKLLGASGSYFNNAYDYYIFILPASALMFIAMTFNGILQGKGQMKQFMYVLMIGTIINIVLDPIFIFLLDLKVKGAALATSIAEGCSLLYLIFIFLRKKSVIKIKWRISNINFSIIKNIVQIGLPQAVSQIVTSFSFLIINKIIILIDSNAMTAFALCARIDQIYLMLIYSIAYALITMAGQNYGRKKYARLTKIWNTSLFSTVVLMLIIATILIFAAPVIYSFFSNVPEVIRYSVSQTQIIIYSFVFASITIISCAFFQGTAKPLPTLVIPLLRMLAISIPLILFFVYILKYNVYGVWFGIIIANIASAIISLFWVNKEIRKLQNIAI